MKKPIYKYPDFVTKVDLKCVAGKRYWLNLKIDDTKKERIIVILKNPSRADKTISDKTVFNVSNYIYRNRNKHQEFKNIGEITILNLIPNYMTDSRGLIEFKETIIDKENFQTIKKFCSRDKKVIIAWGNHPRRLYKEYEELKKLTNKILVENNNQVFFVNRLTKDGNPTHGQVWGYKNHLKKYTKL
tara:strand:- start:95 stop:655 length:561 start_codon:yes stop_codon:yes gene_type:complete